MLGGREYATNRFDDALHVSPPRRTTRARRALPVPTRARPPARPRTPPSRRPAAQMYDVVLKRWRRVSLYSRTAGAAGEPAAPSPSRAALRTGHCASLHGGSILLFGGLNENSQLLDDITTVQLVS